MADAVTTQTIIDGGRTAVLKFTNVSDSTGESSVVKVDVSALAGSNGKACTGVSVQRLWFWTAGMSVNMEWDATADALISSLPADREGYYDFSGFGGIPNNAGAGKTGDILFTTVGHSLGDTYTVILEMTKNYD